MIFVVVVCLFRFVILVMICLLHYFIFINFFHHLITANTTNNNSFTKIKKQNKNFIMKKANQEEIGVKPDRLHLFSWISSFFFFFFFRTLQYVIKSSLHRDQNNW